MINATMVADSISASGNRVFTILLEYPRYIHSELMTHRVFSRNASSSRAIPIVTLIAQAVENTAMPVWTHNEPGMQGKYITDIGTINAANIILGRMLENTVMGVRELADLGIHKQNANRYLEPYQHIKVLVTTTEIDNFFDLRYDEAAQPEIRLLAQAMIAEYYMSTPKQLNIGDWHLPFAQDIEDVELAKKTSASMAAQVSYRKSDDTEEKSLKVFDMLINGSKLHASPFEHQCTPLDLADKQKGNLIGFRQYRQEIELTCKQNKLK